MAEDAPEEIEGIIFIPCIFPKEEMEKTGVAAPTVENFHVPKRSRRDNSWPPKYKPRYLNVFYSPSR